MAYEKNYLNHLKQFGGPDTYWYGRINQSLKRMANIVELEATSVPYHVFRFNAAKWIDMVSNESMIGAALKAAFEFEKFIINDGSFVANGEETMTDANLNYVVEYHFTTFARVKFDPDFATE